MTQGKKLRDKDDTLAAEYALGTLAAAKRLEVEARLLREPELKARVQWWDEKLVPLGDDIKEMDVPAHLYGKIERRLFAEAQKPQGLWHSLGLWRGLAAICLVLSIGLGSFLIVSDQQKTPTSAVLVSQLDGDKTDLKILAVYDPNTKTISLNRVAGAPKDGRDFELWLIPDKQKPISLGVLPRNAKYDIKLTPTLQKDISVTSLFAISDEPLGGSPTGQATGPVVAIGKIISM